MNPEILMTILETLDIESLNQHLQSGTILMKDLEDQLITGIEKIEDTDELFTLFMNNEPVNTINDQYLYNCGFNIPE